MKLIKTDSIGDSFCEKYGVYVKKKENVVIIEDILTQLETNYENSFDDSPSKEDMQNALTFVSLFLSEIGETCSNTSLSVSASHVYDQIDECVIKTVENISEYAT